MFAQPNIAILRGKIQHNKETNIN